jgi:hypothetical protein
MYLLDYIAILLGTSHLEDDKMCPKPLKDLFEEAGKKPMKSSEKTTSCSRLKFLGIYDDDSQTHCSTQFGKFDRNCVSQIAFLVEKNR